MAYTLAQFITQAQAGGGVKITKAEGNTKVVLAIAGQAIELVDDQLTHTLNNGVKTDVHVGASVIDLGTRFSAQAVLDSFQLREAIITGAVIAEAGTAALSLLPTV